MQFYSIRRFLLFFTIFVFSAYSLLASAQPQINAQSLQVLASKSQGRAKKRFMAWKKLILDSRNQSDSTKLSSVNDFFNAFQYEEPLNTEAAKTIWKTPIDFVVRGSGDCKDYAIAKYFTLQAMHFPMNKLHITYVKAVDYNRAHMVLAVSDTEKKSPLVLDNLTSRIERAAARKDLLPVFDFNNAGLWLASAKGTGRYVRSADQFSAWHSLNLRFQQQLVALPS